jgi:hypothetical protein
VAQNLGYPPEFDTTPQELRGEVVATCVRAEGRDTGFLGKAIAHVVDSAFTGPMPKERKPARGALELVDVENVTTGLIERDYPDLVALTSKTDRPEVRGNLLPRQVDELSDTEAGVGEKDDDVLFLAVGDDKNLLILFLGEEALLRRIFFEHLDPLRWVLRSC